MAIRNPIEWGVDQLRHTTSGVGKSVGHDLRRTEQEAHSPLPAVRQMGTAELRTPWPRGVEDFGANRTDVIFLCVMYPIIGLVLPRLAFGYDMLPLLFPLASGFALVGPLAAIGLYEMSSAARAGF